MMYEKGKIVDAQQTVMDYYYYQHSNTRGWKSTDNGADRRQSR